MKQIIITLAIITLIVGPIMTGCQSSAQKQEAAEDKLQDAQKVANAEEWKIFRDEAIVKINENEVRIGELKVKISKPGHELDEHYANRIQTLEQKNNDLRAKIDAYEKNNSDWESFKREFNHDMDELGKALQDLVVNNKN